MFEGSSIDDTVATLKQSKDDEVAVDNDKKRPLPIDLTAGKHIFKVFLNSLWIFWWY